LPERLLLERLLLERLLLERLAGTVGWNGWLERLAGTVCWNGLLERLLERLRCITPGGCHSRLLTRLHYIVTTDHTGCHRLNGVLTAAK
jgi:hypothetical protein